MSDRPVIVRLCALLDAGFDMPTAAHLARLGYDLIGYVATTSLPLSALTGVQG